MTTFQIVALALVGPLALRSLVRLVQRRGRRRFNLLWTLFWATATVALIEPEATNRAAELIGIQRGADLVSYIFILAGSLTFYVMSLQLRRLNTEITVLVRDLAITKAQLRDEAGGPSRGDT